MITTTTKTVFSVNGKEFDTLEEAEYEVAYSKLFIEISDLEVYDEDADFAILDTGYVVKYILQNFIRKVDAYVR